MLLGCLLGAFLPAFLKESDTIGGDKASGVSLMAMSMIAAVFLAVIFAGIPEEDYHQDWSFYTSVSLLGFSTLGLLMLIWNSRYTAIGTWRALHVSNIQAADADRLRDLAIK